MSAEVEFLLNKASPVQIAEHLLCCDADFVPALSGRVEIRDYSRKLASNATRFEAWSNDTLLGLVAVYCNNQETRIAHITNVSVLNAWTGKGIATKLMNQCIGYVKAAGMRCISLEVAIGNETAIKFYEKTGFIADKVADAFVIMNLYLKSGER